MPGIFTPPYPLITRGTNPESIAIPPKKDHWKWVCQVSVILVPNSNQPSARLAPPGSIFPMVTFEADILNPLVVGIGNENINLSGFSVGALALLSAGETGVLWVDDWERENIDVSKLFCSALGIAGQTRLLMSFWTPIQD